MQLILRRCEKTSHLAVPKPRRTCPKRQIAGYEMKSSTLPFDILILENEYESLSVTNRDLDNMQLTVMIVRPITLFGESGIDGFMKWSYDDDIWGQLI